MDARTRLVLKELSRQEYRFYRLLYALLHVAHSGLHETNNGQAIQGNRWTKE